MPHQLVVNPHLFVKLWPQLQRLVNRSDISISAHLLNGPPLILALAGMGPWRIHASIWSSAFVFILWNFDGVDQARSDLMIDRSDLLDSFFVLSLLGWDHLQCLLNTVLWIRILVAWLRWVMVLCKWLVGESWRNTLHLDFGRCWNVGRFLVVRNSLDWLIVAVWHWSNLWFVYNFWIFWIYWRKNIQIVRETLKDKGKFYWRC